MEKILKIEVQMQTNKPLDEEQKVLYSTRMNVEKALADMKALQTQLEEVAKEVSWTYFLYPNQCSLVCTVYEDLNSL